MQTQLENLTALRDAVEAGQVPTVRTVEAVFSNQRVTWFFSAVATKSTDAALQWLAAVLPDFRVLLEQGLDFKWSAWVGPDVFALIEPAKADNPATALILAGLNALIAQLQKEQDDE